MPTDPDPARDPLEEVEAALVRMRELSLAFEEPRITAALSALRRAREQREADRLVIENAERVLKMASMHRDPPEAKAGLYWLPRSPIIYLRDALEKRAALSPPAKEESR